jgi:hypothetical protein
VRGDGERALDLIGRRNGHAGLEYPIGTDAAFQTCGQMAMSLSWEPNVKMLTMLR